MSSDIKPGFYRHYRGPVYWVRGEAINTTNDAHDERVVVYVKAEDKDNADVVPFVRRKTEFLEVIPWPDGYPRGRWMPEETFLPKGRKRGVWVGTFAGWIVQSMVGYIDDLLAGKTPEPRFSLSWARLEAYLDDVLTPGDPPSPSSSHGYGPLPSPYLLLAFYKGDQQAMRDDVQKRLADVAFLRQDRVEMVDLKALSFFLRNYLQPLADQEHEKRETHERPRRRQGCF